jgi:hypothetical protein
MKERSTSLAGSYGVTRKTPAKSTREGLGLNPNLQMESEYVENLLKQIHFLSMEVKLFKEKNEANRGMGIMGLIGKDQMPVVDHAILSNDKFTDMRQKLTLSINELETENLKLQDENSALQAQKEYLAQLVSDFGQDLSSKRKNYGTESEELKAKLAAEKAKKKTMEDDLALLRGQAAVLISTCDKLEEERELKLLN